MVTAVVTIITWLKMYNETGVLFNKKSRDQTLRYPHKNMIKNKELTI